MAMGRRSGKENYFREVATNNVYQFSLNIDKTTIIQLTYERKAEVIALLNYR
jgi:hypothetical protein